MAKGPATRRIDEAIDVVAWSFLGKVVVDVVSSMMFDDEDGLSVSLVRYAKSIKAKDPGNTQVQHASYNGCTEGTQTHELDKQVAVNKVPKMPPLGTHRSTCIPTKEDPNKAAAAPMVVAVGWRNSSVVAEDSCGRRGWDVHGRRRRCCCRSEGFHDMIGRLLWERLEKANDR